MRRVNLAVRIALLASAFAISSCVQSPATDARLGNRPFNHYRLVGTHNAYHLEADPEVKVWLATDGNPPDQGLLQSITYTHLPLEAQLELGVRQFELDLYNDPDGGRFAHPTLAEAIIAQGKKLEAPVDPGGELNKPGFKILHIPDVDWRTTCRTFQSCLLELSNWSNHHPAHFPIVIVLDLKSEIVPVARGLPRTPILPFDANSIDKVESAIAEVIARSRIFTPDDLRSNSESVRQRIVDFGWPNISKIRGKFIFVLSNPSLTTAYIGRNPNMKGRLLFADLEPGDPGAAFVERLDPTDQGIQALEKAGYFVQTFADFRTLAARDDNRTGLEAALNSQSNSISTDYITPDRRFSNYRVDIPGRTEYKFVEIIK
jgi:hypothetical protein